MNNNISYTKLTSDHPRILQYHIHYVRIPLELLDINRVKLLKAVNMFTRYDAINRDDYFKILLDVFYTGINTYVPELGIDKSNYVLKTHDSKKFDIKINRDFIEFSDALLWDTKLNKPVKPVSRVFYHTSVTAGIKALLPSLGSKYNNHSGYSTYRVYFTDSPTTAGAIPLTKGESINDFIARIIEGFTSNISWSIKYLAKLISALNLLHVYELSELPNGKIYRDPESLHNPIVGVYYIETDRPIKVKELNKNNSNELVTMEYLFNKFPKLEEYYNMYKDEITSKVLEIMKKKQLRGTARRR